LNQSLIAFRKNKQDLVTIRFGSEEKGTPQTATNPPHQRVTDRKAIWLKAGIITASALGLLSGVAIAVFLANPLLAAAVMAASTLLGVSAALLIKTKRKEAALPSASSPSAQSTGKPLEPSKEDNPINVHKNGKMINYDSKKAEVEAWINDPTPFVSGRPTLNSGLHYENWKSLTSDAISQFMQQSLDSSKLSIGEVKTKSILPKKIKLPIGEHVNIDFGGEYIIALPKGTLAKYQQNETYWGLPLRAIQVKHSDNKVDLEATLKTCNAYDVTVKNGDQQFYLVSLVEPKDNKTGINRTRPHIRFEINDVYSDDGIKLLNEALSKQIKKFVKNHKAVNNALPELIKTFQKILFIDLFSQYSVIKPDSKNEMVYLTHGLQNTELTPITDFPKGKDFHQFDNDPEARRLLEELRPIKI